GLQVAFGATGGGLLSSLTFGNVTDNHDGTYSAPFTGDTAFGAATFTVTATLNGAAITTPLPTVTVTPALPLARLAITNVSAGAVVAGSAVTFTVAAEDSSGSPVPSYTGTIQLVSTDGHALLGANRLPASYSFTAGDNGAHTFKVTLASAGSQ